MIRIATGQICTADVKGEDDDLWKNRSVLVIDRKLVFAEADKVELLVITGTIDRPEGVYADIPWYADGHSATGLTKECWVALHWYKQMGADLLTLTPFRHCPPKKLYEIMRARAKLER